MTRYCRGFRDLLGRPEAAVVAVIHALPIAYVQLALDGVPPRAKVDLTIEHARPHALGADELRRALDVLEAWRDAPDW